MLRFTLLLILLLILPRAEGQEVAEAPVVAEAQGTDTAHILEGLMEQIERVKGRLKVAPNDEEEARLEETLARLRKEFDELLAGKESVAYFQPNPVAETIQEELLDIFNPLIGELKSITSDSREKESLRNEIQELEFKNQAAESAVKRIQKQLIDKDGISSGLRSVLQGKLGLWNTRAERTSLELESARIQLTEREKKSRSSVESASQVIANFFRTRGFHLVMALGMSILVYAMISCGYGLFTKYSPTHKKEKYYNTSKTIDGAVHLASFLASLIVLLLTLYLFDDWVLLTAALLLIVGVFWTLKDKFADFMEEIRLILNTGAVREGERTLYQGLSWKVEKIRVYSQLINPELDGGIMRIPINKMVGLHSHPDGANLRYFPTSKSDWVILSDGTFGKVLHQTPEFVELVQLGGAHKTYRTDAFLDLTPENLSISSFRIASTFGVDYKHQAKVTDEIAAQLLKDVEEGIRAYLEEPAQLVRIKVEFASAASSSLDFKILADFKSEVAPKYQELTRLIQRQAVEACNANGWEIPFTQITLHKANDGAEKGDS